MRRQINSQSLYISIACFVILLLFFFLGFFSSIDVKAHDVLLSQKNSLSTITVVGIDDESLQEIGRWPWNRSTIADIVNAIPSQSVIGIDVGFFEKSNLGVGSELLSEDDKKLADAFSRHGNVVLVSTRNEDDSFQIPVFNNVRYGYADVITDADGITRATRFDLSKTHDAFSVVLYDAYFGTKPASILDGRVRINFIGPAESFETISAKDILSGSFVMPTQRIVLIGATAQSLKDTFQTPLGGGLAMPGVEVHANVLQMLITQRFLTTLSVAWIVLFMFLASAIAYLLSYLKQPAIRTIVCVFVAIVYLFLAIAFSRKDVLLPVLYPLLALVVTHAILSIADYILTQREKREMKHAFGKYVSPKVIEQLLDNPSKLQLGGEKKKIGILFSDIRGFTSLSEKMTPQQLVTLLNSHLSVMTTLILERDGMIDKYIGDAIMALWNVPLRVNSFADKMAQTALLMQQKKVSEKIEIGVGLHIGEAIVGNIGSNERYDYTAIGDSVNLGSRLEGLTKQYGVGIIASESVVSELSSTFICRELDFVQVKGKKKPVTIYEICNRRESWHETFAKALAMYRAGKFLDARKIFITLAAVDKTSKLFVERCDKLISEKPHNWTGVWAHTSK